MFNDIQAILLHHLTLPLVAIALLCLAVFWTLLGLRPETKPRPKRFSENPMMDALAWFGVILFVPGVLFVAYAFLVLIVLAWKYPAADDPASNIQWHASVTIAMLAAIGGVFTLVFAFIRAFATERQTSAIEEGLITDRINKAVEGLGAMKIVEEDDLD